MISVFEASILAKPDPDDTKKGPVPFHVPFIFDFSPRKDYPMVRKETK